METNTSTTAYCVECGAKFPIDDMIRHGNAFVCAGCKPVFLQKLAEGAAVTKKVFHYAGFWRRVVATLIDGTILAILNLSLRFIGMSIGTGFALLLQMAAGIAYEVILIGKYGATVGKTMCRMEVVTADGGSVSYLLAFGRYFAKLLSSIILGIGYLMVAFDNEKRGLHDRLCNTRVIVK